MQINRISIKNVQGVRSIEYSPERRVVLVSGPNGAGKSTLLEAIRMAMLGVVGRVDLKKHYNQLVTEGEKLGVALVETDGGGRCALTLPNGAHEAEGMTLPCALPFLLDMHAFSHMDVTGRREHLLRILDVSQEPEAIASRLIADMACDADKVSKIAPILESGFDTAHRHAKQQASEARGAWKAITGETYGEKKAETWKAEPVELVSEEALAAAKLASSETAAAHAEAAKALGAIEQQAKQYAAAVARVDELEAAAGKIDRIRDKLKRDQAEHQIWQDKLAALPPEPGAVDVRPAMACPECGSMLIVNAGRLEAHNPGKIEDHEVSVKRVEQRKAVEMYARAIDAGTRDLSAAERAKFDLDEIKALEPVGDGAVTAARTAAAEAWEAHQKAQAEHTKLLGLQAQAERAEQLTQTAATYHADVLAWSKLADALSPDGLQARMVGDALAPINKELLAYADDTGWMASRIGADMGITANGRPYGLLSESEKWRVDAMLTVAIATVSGVRMCAIDRFDVLHPNDRPEALLWLDEMAEQGRIDQVWLAGTLKTRPVTLPPNCEALWIENGRASAALKEAA